MENCCLNFRPRGMQYPSTWRNLSNISKYQQDLVGGCQFHGLSYPYLGSLGESERYSLMQLNLLSFVIHGICTNQIKPVIQCKKEKDQCIPRSAVMGSNLSHDNQGVVDLPRCWKVGWNVNTIITYNNYIYIYIHIRMHTTTTTTTTHTHTCCRMFRSSQAQSFGFHCPQNTTDIFFQTHVGPIFLD